VIALKTDTKSRNTVDPNYIYIFREISSRFYWPNLSIDMQSTWGSFDSDQTWFPAGSPEVIRYPRAHTHCIKSITVDMGSNPLGRRAQQSRHTSQTNWEQLLAISVRKRNLQGFKLTLYCEGTATAFCFLQQKNLFLTDHISTCRTSFSHEWEVKRDESERAQGN